jgi:Xaa-Pro aminopeptidase
MTLSIEIPSYDVPEYRVIGGFLEDMVLVTEHGHENFTAAVPHDLWIVE